MYIATDTHPWVWYLTANPRLSLKAKEEFGQPVALVTLDKAISSSNLVPVIW